MLIQHCKNCSFLDIFGAGTRGRDEAGVRNAQSLHDEKIESVI